MPGPAPLSPPPLPAALGYHPVRIVEPNPERRAAVVVALAFSSVPGWRVSLFDGVIDELAFAAPGGGRSPLWNSAIPVLEGLLEVLAEHPTLSVTVSVTSSEGETLRERRQHALGCARTLVDHLSDLGVDRRRLIPAPQAAPLSPVAGL